MSNNERVIRLDVRDETTRLEAVILGIATSVGNPGSPFIHPDKWKQEEAPPEDTVTDPKSRHFLMKGEYPIESDLRRENEHFARVLLKHNIRVYRPINLSNDNQIFTRDIGFVIDKTFIKGNMRYSSRQTEFAAILPIVERICARVLYPPKKVYIEGGDIFPYKNYIFVGQAEEKDEKLRCNRTNQEAIDFLKKHFPGKDVVPIHLKKSDKNPHENCLHLDCAFQPVGNNNHAIIYRNGFVYPKQADLLIDLFGGQANVHEITKEEMFNMNSNIFSISPTVVVSGDDEKEFGRLNHFLESIGITVEKIPYSETSKLGGLLRCSTLPLRRSY